jgi:hypothetical protein
VGYGHLWASNNLDEHQGSLGNVFQNDDSWERYRLDDLLRGKLITRTGAKEGIPLFEFMPGGGPLGYSSILEIVTEGDADDTPKYPFRLDYDFVPISEDELRLFQLCNVADADQGEPKPDAETDNLILIPVPERGEEKYQKPAWSLGVFRFHAEWNAKDGWWGNGTWKREGNIAVGFRESFRVIGQGDDYFFVTQSGRLYRAPKPDKGTDRKMDTVWKDDQRPIVAFITDADADRSFLFCKPDKDGKGVYFEMSDKPDPQSYDATKFPEVKPDDPLPAVLGYAKILVADKKIKDKE